VRGLAPPAGGGRLTGFDFLPFDRERGYDLVDRLRAIAGAHGATPAQAALARRLTRPAVASVLVGASRPEQLDDNLRAADVALTADDLRALDEATAPAPVYPGWFNARVFDAAARDALAPPAGGRG
jgi:aryl-alcohol dehydrogenase-like predicted oxidoreductase